MGALAFGSSESAPRVLLLGIRASSLTDTSWPMQGTWFRLQAACPEAIDPDVLPCDVRRVRPDAVSRATSLRVLAAWARSQMLAGRVRASPTWLWAIKRDRWLRQALRDADVVVSMDVDTDRVLALIPELLPGCTVVPYAESEGLADGTRALADVLARLAEIIEERQRPIGMKRRLMKGPRLDAFVGLVDPTVAKRIPGALLPVADVAQIVRFLTSVVGPVQTAVIVHDVLGAFRWDEASAFGMSGMAAQQASARLWRAETEAELPSEARVDAAVRAALMGADLALERRDAVLARGRLVDAILLMFHRERHTECVHSPLVADPVGFLEALWANQTFQKVRNDVRPPRLHRVPSESAGPRVLVLASDSGQFHRPVVEALAQVATVTVTGPEIWAAFLSRRGLDMLAIEALVRLGQRGSGDLAPDPWGAGPASKRVVRALGPQLSRTDVVFADWADRLSVWASHMVPDGVRFVLRIHSVDALHPLFHLVNWRNVDHVLVVSEALRLFVAQMLVVAAADVPVTVVPNLIALTALDRPKHADARTTLGMIGWGRRVKDPLWALDLLARDPSWRLVLIGHDLHPPSSRLAALYNDAVRARLRDPSIAHRVDVVGWTDDIAHELQRIGVILSASRRESWHLGLVEGAASGSVPVVRDWPLFRPVGGARSLYPDDWVVNDVDEAEARVRLVTEPATWEVARQRAREQARELFDPKRASERYRELILGLPPTR